MKTKDFSTGLLTVILILTANVRPGISRPNILFIVADDLGWNDVSWHNSEIIMPHLDELARNGVILNQSYVQPVCTPSRTAFMSGYYPYHVGRQNKLIEALIPTGLSTKLTLLPEVLRGLGYKTHAVGKWHLGYCNLSYTPTFRGFDSFFGYYLGSEEYYNHTRKIGIPGTKISETGYDFWNNTISARERFGQYSTEVFEKAATDIISNHQTKQPLFLYLPFQAVHSPIEVPKRYERLYKYHNLIRRKFCGMVTAMDDAVGAIVNSLKTRGIWNNTVVIFTTDNGGQTLAGGNNWPLRGNKHTLWEGGTRGVAFVSGPNLHPSVSNSLVHAVDWYPTIVSIAGGDLDYDGDGVDQWPALKAGQPGPRQEFVYNIFDDTEVHGAIRVGHYKLIVGNPGKPDGWIPPPDYSAEDNVTLDNGPDLQLRLYNLLDDPLETHDLVEEHPDIVGILLRRLLFYRSTMVPADDPSPDPRGRPSLWNNSFAPGWCQAK